MDAVIVLRQMQLEKVKGELRTLKLAYYDPMGNNEQYDEIEKMIENMIHELDNEIG